MKSHTCPAVNSKFPAAARWNNSLKILLMAAVLGIVTNAVAQQTADPRVADLVRAGRVRLGLFLPLWAKDPATGELKGVGSVGVSCP